MNGKEYQELKAQVDRMADSNIQNAIAANKATAFVFELFELMIAKGVITEQEANAIAQRVESATNQGISQGTRKANAN